MSMAQKGILVLIVTMIGVGLAVGAGSTVVNDFINSLMGNQSSEGLINQSSNYSYGDTPTNPVTPDSDSQGNNGG